MEKREKWYANKKNKGYLKIHEQLMAVKLRNYFIVVIIDK